MPGLCFPKHKRTAAGIMGILMLIAVLLSSFYITAEVNHDCCGEDCPVCACMQQCEHTLHRTGGGSAVQAAVMMPVLLLLFSAFLTAFELPQETPVLNKVRLNN